MSADHYLPETVDNISNIPRIGRLNRLADSPPDNVDAETSEGLVGGDEGNGFEGSSVECNSAISFGI